jgi:hypothetical protein
MQSKNKLVVMTSLLLLATGCLDSPRNGQTVPQSSTQSAGATRFSGLITRPGQFVEVHMQNFSTSAWNNTAYRFTSGTSPITDALGMKWYVFEGNHFFSRNRNWWRAASPVGSQRRLRANVAVHDSSDGYLSTFDTSADQCADNNASGGVFGVINNCASNNSPKAEVFRACGRPDQDCCIGHNIPSADACNNGRVCNGNEKCATPSGGLNQVCNGDGSCGGGRTCIANTCRDTTIENVPVLTLELEVRNCSDASILTGGNSEPQLSVELGTGQRFYLDAPGDQGRLGATDTYGLVIPGVATLGDVRGLTIYANRDRFCADRIRLNANGRRVFEKTYPSSALLYLNPAYPFNEERSHRISRDELRTHWTQLDSAAHCGLPTQIAGTAMQRAITALIGNGLRRPNPMLTQACIDDADEDTVKDDCSGSLECRSGRCYDTINNEHFRDGDTVTVTRASATRYHVRATFTADRVGSNYDGANIDLQLDLDIDVSCAGAAFALTPTNDNLRVTDIDFDDPLADIANVLSHGLLEAFVKFAANSDDDLTIGDGINAVMQSVPACPGFSLNTSTPPTLTFNYSAIPAALLPTNVCL